MHDCAQIKYPTFEIKTSKRREEYSNVFYDIKCSENIMGIEIILI